MKKEEKATIFNIGYQGSTGKNLIDTLKFAQVTLLVDLREKPYSRMPDFNQKRFKIALEKQGIKYKWMGKVLGGFTCTKDMWLEGCDQLAIMSRSDTIAIMCMEADVMKCHRKKLTEFLGFFHGITNIDLKT